MVADRRKVQDRIDRIRRYKRDLEEFGRIPREAFRANRERQYAVLHAMQNAIEGCIEIASHIVSADRLGAPADYAHLFTLLEENQVIPPAVAEDLDFPFERLPWPQLHAEGRMRLRDLFAYMRTWSASQTWERNRGTDPVDVVREDLARAWGRSGRGARGPLAAARSDRASNPSPAVPGHEAG